MKRRVFALARCGLGLCLCIWPAVAVGQARITKAVLGTGATEKYEIVSPASEFAPDTPKIYCAYEVEGMTAGTPVRAVWIAEDVGDAAPPNYKIDETQAALYTKGVFALSTPTTTGWPPGKYRLEIYLGTNLAKTVPFTVKAK